MTVLSSKVQTRLAPQVKICGLTSVSQAVACAEAGADAVGCVFYAKSPRYVDDRTATDICSALPEHIARVGVFVNDAYDTIMAKIETCGLTAVQLHGRETPELVKRLIDRSVTVIKALYVEGDPSVDLAASYHASAYLVECKHAALPGGNALSWDWTAARPFSKQYPTVLAGGLTASNIEVAIASARPDAVDVSSGVELRPGRKDIERVSAFIKAVSRCESDHPARRIF